MDTKTCEVLIYTQNGAIPYEVVETCENFAEKLAAALEQGSVMLDTIDGSKLIINPINAAAIEIRESEKRETQ